MGVDLERAVQIAALNDVFRQTNNGLFVTHGLRVAIEDMTSVLRAIRRYEQFDTDNDPWGEHDFGTLEMQGKKIFWKIDYYDQKLEGWCDPLKPECRRVLTVMLADEY